MRKLETNFEIALQSGFHPIAHSGIVRADGWGARERSSHASLVVIVYPSEEKAEEVRKRLFELQVEHLIKIGDAVIATKTESGSVKLNQMMNMTAAGAAAGSMWGLLIGVLFLNPLIGVAAGAASGALAVRSPTSASTTRS